MRCDVVLQAVSAAIIHPDEVMVLRAGPGSIELLESISYLTSFDSDPPGVLVCHVRGDAASLEEAAQPLANSGRRNWHTLAVAANAAILDPHLQVAYEPRAGGRFGALAATGTPMPHTARRVIDTERAFKLIEAFDQHPDSGWLRRAAENYAESLRRITSASIVHTVMHLFIAVECLTDVIAKRITREQGIERHELADVLDVAPRPGETVARDGDVRGAIRLREIFSGDEETHRALKRASDGLEHGFGSFADIKGLADAAFPKSARYVRECILREAGLPAPDVAALVSGIYTRPLPLWRPLVMHSGRLAEETEVDPDSYLPLDFHVEATLEVQGFVPETHGTEAKIGANIRIPPGPPPRLEQMGLASPGEVVLPGDQAPQPDEPGEPSHEAS